MDRLEQEYSPEELKYYHDLYILQDQVLETVFSTESEFYLTGGTCLSRFYTAARYSDDLDFFTNDSTRFAFALRNIRNALSNRFSLVIEVDTKNFLRMRVDQNLQIDFVNDGPYRYKDPVVTEQKYLIDNLDNILSNKLTALIGRDNPKDVFDIILMYTYYTFSWTDILTAAHKKAGFTNEDLVIRLKSFPSKLFDQIKCIDCSFLENYENSVLEISEKILTA